MHLGNQFLQFLTPDSVAFRMIFSYPVKCCNEVQVNEHGLLLGKQLQNLPRTFLLTNLTIEPTILRLLTWGQRWSAPGPCRGASWALLL